MSKKINDYIFTGNINRGPNGEYLPLKKEDLGRPLTHDEMDYNLTLAGEIIKQFEVRGNGTDNEIAMPGDIGKTLVLRKDGNDDYFWALEVVQSGGGGGTGSQGAQGATGFQGAAGANGAIGAQGATGAAGTSGKNGANGAQGAMGAQGATGVQGATGTSGTSGTSAGANQVGAHAIWKIISPGIIPVIV